MSRYGGFRVGKARIINDWNNRRSASSTAAAPTAAKDFDYSTAQGIWNLTSTTQFPKISGDPYFSGVALLLHGDGSNNSTVFADSSSASRTITASGNARILTTIKQFGTGSMFFDGSGDYLTVLTDPILDLLTNSFTLETWIYPTSTKSGGMRIFAAGGGTVGWNATNGIHVLLQLNNASRNLNLQLSSGTTTPRQAVSAGTVALNTWTHVAATFNGSTQVQLFINGVREGFTVAAPVRPSANPTTTIATIPGENGGSTNAFTGHMDELRVTQGVVRYSADFVPATLPFLDN